VTSAQPTPDPYSTLALLDVLAGAAAGAGMLAESVPAGGPQVIVRCVTDDEVEAALLRAADEANARIASCHERVACPKCRAPVGERCRRMPRGYSPASASRGMTQPGAVVGPHRERWTLVQPER
jgi:hypothetical protein